MLTLGGNLAGVGNDENLFAIPYWESMKHNVGLSLIHI